MQEHVFYFQLVSGTRIVCSLFTNSLSFSGRQEIKAALPIMCRSVNCIWAELQFKLRRQTHCLQALGWWVFVKGFRWHQNKTSPTLTSAHTILGMCTPPPQGPVCDPVWTSLTLCEACVLPAVAKYSLTNHISGWGDCSQPKYHELTFHDLKLVNRWFQQRSQEVNRLCLNPEYKLDISL